ncbi:calcium-binding protein, partial [Methylocucumis oryzae]
NTDYNIESFKFTDTTLSLSQVNALTLTGDAGDNTLFGWTTYDSLSGAAGNDNVSGMAGNDTLNGGAGDDTLHGGIGNDTYQFGVGSGNDSISEWDYSGRGGTDQITFTGLKQADVSFAKTNNYDLVATIKSTGEILYISDTFYSNTDYNIESFKFTDTTLSLSQVNSLTLTGDGGDNTLFGWTTYDSLTGAAGNDNVSGMAGNDTLDGGAGDDTLHGGIGNDTYQFGVGSGNDSISEWDYSGRGGTDQVTFVGLKQADVSFAKSDDFDLIATIKSTGEFLYIFDTFYSDTSYNIESFKFNDITLSLSQVKDLAEKINHLPTGTVSIDDTTPEQFQILTATNTLDDIDGLGTITYTWSANNTVLGVGASYTVSADDLGKKISVTASYTDALGNLESVSSTTTKAVVLAKLNLNGTSGNDLLSGGGSNDTLSGNAGNDLLDGDFGDDILNGGDGDDLLNGGAGKDILNGNAGTDILRGSYGKDTFIFNSTLDGTIDTLADFRAADDTIKLENAIFTQLNKTGTLKAEQFAISANALDANDYIIYTPSTGALSYDADGNGAGASVQFAVVGVNLALTNVDFVVI